MISALKSFVRWSVVVSLTMAVGLAIGSAVRHVLSPIGVAMVPSDGSQDVDPRKPVTIEARGLGTRMTAIKMHDGDGRLLAESFNRKRFTLSAPLDFGTRYRFTATVERAWTGQRLTRELTLITVDRPVLEGPAERTMAPDGSVTLHFDQPVGDIAASAPSDLTVEAGEDRQSFRLILAGHPQGQMLPVHLNWSTRTGVSLPPLQLAVMTPPALMAEIAPHDLANVGLSMPIQISFSESLANRELAGRSVSVQTEAGTAVSGKWSWIGRSRLQFNPRPEWPASTTIQVNIDPHALRSARGGTLDVPAIAQFSTGTDRRIFVYLDSQRMSAVENGQVVRTFKVSTGKPKTPTIAGSFYIYARFPTKTMRSRAKPGEPGHYVVENVPYAQYFHADYAFHGAWWHNAFGSPASHGCVNMSTRRNNKRWPGASEDAGWLYHWASLGVPVTVLRSTPSPQLAMQ